MTKETKQDVFESMLDDLVMLQEDFDDETQVHRRDMTGVIKTWKKMYAAASPCKLPVLPKAVGEYINAQRPKSTLIEAGTCALYHLIQTRGLTDESASWITKHPDAFATAWLLDDWEVEDD